MTEHTHEEVFALIRGYSNYQVTSHGRVINKDTGRELKGTVHRDGYRQVALHKNGEQTTHLVHRLVAQTFLYGYRRDRVISHKNENRLDNRFDNLRMARRRVGNPRKKN